MNAKRKIRRALVTMLSVALLAACTLMPAMAADPVNQVTFTKTIDMSAASGATVPNATYSYTIAVGTAVPATATSPEILAGESGATITSTVTFGSGDAIATNKVSKDVTVDFSNVTFSHAGIYRYVITETDPTVAGLNCDGANTIYLDVYVTNAVGGCEISDYVMTTSVNAPNNTTGAPVYDAASKFTGDEDAYTTYTLTVTKNIEGTMADLTGTFSIDVDFTNLSNGTKVTVDGTPTMTGALNHELSVNKSLGDNGTMRITGIPADAVYTVVENLSSNAGYSVTYTHDDDTPKDAGYSNGEYTTVNASQMGSANHDVVVINTKNAVSPTGVIMNVAPYALMVVIAAAGAFVFLRKRAED